MTRRFICLALLPFGWLVATAHAQTASQSSTPASTAAPTSAAGASIANPAAASSAEPLTEAKRANIRKLLELTGVRAIPEQIANSTVQSMVPGIRQLDPKFPERGFLIMRDAILAGLNAKLDGPGGLIEQVTLVYHNHFTAAEVAETLKFYESAAGKKVINLQGKINGETYQTAMRWADSLGPEIDQRIDAALKRENIKLPDPPKAEQGGPRPTPNRTPAKEAPKKP
ncbi:MAG: DUF2059 domain-containing protein [Casimicrobiaceae bacterium]|nr:DUF2059 domain-containing protein [Casimicrobiaceae bacterium]MDW8311359.1 DUF2059 domain-containing protein [Burkholderiales bacterium]